MQPKTWRELLGGVISDPEEKQRIANELEVNLTTLSRWASGELEPQLKYMIQPAESLIPEKNHSFFLENLLKDFLEDLLKDLLKEEISRLKETSTTYRFKSHVDHSAPPPPDTPSSLPWIFAPQEPSQPTKQLAESKVFSFRIDQEPLNVHNLASVLSSLSELATKYWLISEGRFADLIEYTQTHNPRFEEKANMVITKITYNSPINVDLKAGATDIAQALVTTIDGVTQVGKRLRKAELEIEEKEQALKEAQQRADQAEKKSELEREKQQLEIEKQRLELQKQTLEIQVQQLEFQKKSFEYAIEMATKVVDTLRPGLDPDTRAMAVQAVLPNWIQLQNSKGLELVLPAVPSATKSEEDKSSI